MVFIFSLISTGLKFSSVNHSSIYEYSVLNVFKNIKLLEMFIRAYSLIINKINRSLYIIWLLEEITNNSNKYCIFGLTFQSKIWFSVLLPSKDKTAATPRTKSIRFHWVCWRWISINEWLAVLTTSTFRISLKTRTFIERRSDKEESGKLHGAIWWITNQKRWKCW